VLLTVANFLQTTTARKVSIEEDFQNGGQNLKKSEIVSQIAGYRQDTTTVPILIATNTPNPLCVRNVYNNSTFV